MLRSLGIALALVLATLFAYSRAEELDFVDYDDPFFVLDNPTVNGGLTRAGLVRAFTTTHHGQWQPASWTAHMLDVELYGLEPAGHHRSSVILHALNVLLVFAVLARTTGRRVAAGFVALLFAVHPLHVESVAWIASRKDLVSLGFGLVALWLYAGHRGGSLLRAPGRLTAIALAQALALMGKPMLVTLPCVMLLLDAWPLGRWAKGPGRARPDPVRADLAQPEPVPADPVQPDPGRLGLGALVLEKLPLFALSAAAAVVVRLAVDAEGRAPDLSFQERALNAVVSYGRYLRKTVWPSDLAAAYPHPSLTIAGGWPWWSVALSAAVLVSGFALAWRVRRRAPYATVGWLWWAGTLVPVLGLSSLSGHSLADRYTYLPALGLYLAVVFASVDLAGSRAVARAGACALGLALAAVLALTTRAQTAHWTDTEAVWLRALSVTRYNYVAHANLGRLLMERGDDRGALANYVAAIRAKPDIAEPHANLGVLYERRGELESAVAAFRRALTLEPEDDDIRANLALVLLKLDQLDEARELLADLVVRVPRSARVRNGYGLLLQRTGRAEDGLADLALAVELEPLNPAFQDGLGRGLLAAGRAQESLAPFRRALQLDPELFETQVNLGLALQLAGDTVGARRELERAAGVDPGVALVRRHLGGLLLDAGEFEGALTHLEATLERAGESAELHGLIAYANERLERWQAAVDHYRRAVELEPDVAANHNNMAGALWRSGRLLEAADVYARALEVDPELAQAHANLGLLRQSLGDLPGAERAHRRAVELDPDQLSSAENLAWILATSPDAAQRDGAEAVRWAEHVVERAQPARPLQLATLAAAYAEAGRFEEAVRRQREALEHMPARRVREQEERLELYRRGEPYRDRPLDEREH